MSKVICDHFRICPAREECKAAKPHAKNKCFICDKYSGKPKCILFKEYILCAAIYYNDFIKHEQQPFNIKTGYVVCGLRHCNCFAIAQMITTIRHPQIQGFITNFGKFVDRKEAFNIAEKAGQLLDMGTKSERSLISEDLY